MIKLKASPSGLLRGEFLDRLGQDCSIQESSETEEDCIWIGLDKDFRGDEMFSRMHLTQDMAKDLIPLLRAFVTTGSLEEGVDETYRVGVWVKGVAGSAKGMEGRIIATNAEGITVQDNHIQGAGGLTTCAWKSVSVLYEPMEKPEYLMSRFERIRTEGL